MLILRERMYLTVDFPDGAVVKNLLADTGDVGLIPGLGKSPGEGNGNPLGIFAWRIPRTEDPGRLQSMRSQRVRHENTTE